MHNEAYHPGTPKHLARLIQEIYEGPQVNIKGIRWVQAPDHSECLVSVEELAQRSWPQDFTTKAKGQVPTHVRNRRAVDIAIVRKNLRKAKRNLLKAGYMAELTNEYGFYAKSVAKDAPEAMPYLPGPGRVTFGISVNTGQDGARFAARIEAQGRVLHGVMKNVEGDIRIATVHGLLTDQRRADLIAISHSAGTAAKRLAEAIIQPYGNHQISTAEVPVLPQRASKQLCD